MVAVPLNCVPCFKFDPPLPEELRHAAEVVNVGDWTKAYVRAQAVGPAVHKTWGWPGIGQTCVRASFREGSQSLASSSGISFRRSLDTLGNESIAYKGRGGEGEGETSCITMATLGGLEEIAEMEGAEEKEEKEEEEKKRQEKEKESKAFTSEDKEEKMEEKRGRKGAERSPLMSPKPSPKTPKSSQKILQLQSQSQSKESKESNNKGSESKGSYSPLREGGESKGSLSRNSSISYDGSINEDEDDEEGEGEGGEMHTSYLELQESDNLSNSHVFRIVDLKKSASASADADASLSLATPTFTPSVSVDDGCLDGDGDGDGDRDRYRDRLERGDSVSEIPININIPIPRVSKGSITVTREESKVSLSHPAGGGSVYNVDRHTPDRLHTVMSALGPKEVLGKY